MSDGKKKVISATVDEENVDWLDANNINRSGLINDLITKYRTGEDNADMAVRRMRLSQIDQQIETNRDEIERLENEKERIKTRVGASEQQYCDELDDILELMENQSMTLSADNPRIERLARDRYGDVTDATTVIDDLRERAGDRDIHDEQWGDT